MSENEIVFAGILVEFSILAAIYLLACVILDWKDKRREKRERKKSQ